MKRWWIAVVIGLLSVPLGYAQSSAQQVPPNAPPSNAAAADNSSSASLIRGSFALVLPKGIDSKKLKDGDTVVCLTVTPLRTSAGIIPSGSKVYAHVTEAKARSKGDAQSSLALAFDKIEIAKGKEVAMKGTLQAVGPNLGEDSGPNTGAAGSGVLAGRGDTYGGTTPPPQPINSMSQPGAKPILIPTSEGVLGIKNLQMTKDGVLTSPNKEVKLDNGTQLLVRAEIQVPSH